MITKKTIEKIQIYQNVKEVVHRIPTPANVERYPTLGGLMVDGIYLW